MKNRFQDKFETGCMIFAGLAIFGLLAAIVWTAIHFIRMVW